MSDDVGADRLRELGKQLPYERPDHERREALRSSLLVAATQADPSTGRKRWLLVGGGFAAGALAAAAIAFLVAPRDPTAPPVREAHARIDAAATAQLEHTVIATASGTDEVVRVRAGVVRVAVPVVERGDRVRMQTADAEVEGTGAYEVAVVDDRLERITVNTGTARLRVSIEGQQQHVFLAAGQTWRPKIVTAEIELSPRAPVVANPAVVEAVTPVVEPANANPAVVEPAKPAVVEAVRPPPVVETAKATTVVEAVRPPPVETPRAKATTVVEELPAVTSLPLDDKRQPTSTERHFQTGWALLRAGKAREAAVELGAAADAGGRDPLAADARYFQAVALVRAGDAAAAERVLVAFLDSAPASLRRGRAALLLGKLLRDRGDIKSARAWFESARTDGDPAIAAAARAHLDSLP